MNCILQAEWFGFPFLVAAASNRAPTWSTLFSEAKGGQAYVDLGIPGPEGTCG